MYVVDTITAKSVSVETRSWLVPELEGDGAVISGDSGKDVGDPSDVGDVGDSSDVGDVGDSSDFGDVGDPSDAGDVGDWSDFGDDVGDSSEDGEVIGVPADGETASILSFVHKIS
ncbi:Uncharacterized protein Rs2_09629 [Raphanus sativus]|nr:Uncharacterized protein Rs2_09629 [Raphanus sativus]